jgi:hypothetical protein
MQPHDTRYRVDRTLYDRLPRPKRHPTSRRLVEKALTDLVLQDHIRQMLAKRGIRLDDEIKRRRRQKGQPDVYVDLAPYVMLFREIIDNGRPLSKKQVMTKMQKVGYSPADINEAVDHIPEEGILDTFDIIRDEDFDNPDESLTVLLERSPSERFIVWERPADPTNFHAMELDEFVGYAIAWWDSEEKVWKTFVQHYMWVTEGKVDPETGDFTRDEDAFDQLYFHDVDFFFEGWSIKNARPWAALPAPA